VTPTRLRREALSSRASDAPAMTKLGRDLLAVASLKSSTSWRRSPRAASLNRRLRPVPFLRISRPGKQSRQAAQQQSCRTSADGDGRVVFPQNFRRRQRSGGFGRNRFERRAAPEEEDQKQRKSDEASHDRSPSADLPPPSKA